MSMLELNCENSKQLNELISEKDVQRGFEQLDMAGILQNIFIFIFSFSKVFPGVLARILKDKGHSGQLFNSP